MNSNSKKINLNDIRKTLVGSKEEGGALAQVQEKVLEKLQRAAQSDENLMPFIINAVKSYCTVGEISDVLRSVFGEYKESVVV